MHALSLNNSTSKPKYSFSKSPRFIMPRPQSTNAFYQIQSTKSARHTSFGIGDRCKMFQGKREVPQPGQYEKDTSFDKKGRKGFGFGIHRDQAKFDNYIKMIDTNIPAPNNYQIKTTKHARSYSLRPKTAYPRNYFLPSSHQCSRLQQLPGPGAYQTVDPLGSSAPFHISNHPNHQARSFKGCTQRFHDARPQTSRTVQSKNQTIAADGIYFLSNMRTSGRKSLLERRKQTKILEPKHNDQPQLSQVKMDA